MSLPATIHAPYSMVPTSFDEAVKISQLLAKSELVPKDYRNKPENVFVAMQWGAEIGLKALQALQNIAVINGRPSVWGDAALAIVQNRADCEDINEVVAGDGDNRTGTCTIKRKGRSAVVRTFSIGDAKKAGLWGKQGPWQQYPDRMLQMRARGFAIRDAFPDALRGLNLAEELQGVEIDVTPGQPAAAPAQAPARPEREMYADADFDKNMPKWRDAVEAGKSSPDRIIATVSSKYELTEAQKQAIRDLSIEEASE